ncbi:MAG: VWA domain-containing protein [Candidatus Viridilinea halotolerans]|uniref:VWA domain-containing protein n=1 Tax=Candidatus Viridilinea halotolerans TaxID=2491704 RepID=A0A426TQ73_9CHLR|nr:MAG: VWA domain-containing protein [Candidatus Viridilinea halotolerans]
MTLFLRLQPPVVTLRPHTEAQICYALVTVAADAGGAALPVSWAVVADASRSMRIPIVSEEQFRDLVRHGGAQEVLVDGVPVWQLTGPVPDTIRNVAPSALDHTARALHSIIERMDREDRLCLVACAEDAVLLAAADGARRADLVAGLARLPSLNLGEETDLAAGLRLALAELGFTETTEVSRVILLTDGFTRDSTSCLELARAAAARGVSISTLGLGGEFQDDLLTEMADLSGGRAIYLRHAEEIPAAVAAELDAARGVQARALQLELHLPRGVALRHATRLNPALAPMHWQAQAEGRRLTLALGDLERGTPIRLLLELLAPPTPPRPTADGARVRLAALRAVSGEALATADLVAHYTPQAHGPSVPILAAAARASAMRLQRRARAAAAAGDARAAAKLLQAVAARMAALGETALAQAALHEAEALATTGHGTAGGAVELTYATRRLGEG